MCRLVRRQQAAPAVPLWPPLDAAAAADWQVIATGIVNRDQGEEPFVLDATGRTLTVDFA